jgi:hypothetical protein
MSVVNPYESPTVVEKTVRTAGEPTLAKGVGFVLATMALFSAIGAALALAIAEIAPQYYAQVFNVPPGGQAIAAGVMLGLVQGGGTGIAVGVALFGITAWMHLRLKTIAALRSDH